MHDCRSIMEEGTTPPDQTNSQAGPDATSTQPQPSASQTPPTYYAPPQPTFQRSTTKTFMMGLTYCIVAFVAAAAGAYADHAIWPAPSGRPGIQGLAGEVGPQGTQGPQGPAGASGNSTDLPFSFSGAQCISTVVPANENTQYCYVVVPLHPG